MKFKILTIYHRPAQIPSDPIYQPIFVGSAVSHLSSKDGKVSEEELSTFLQSSLRDDDGIDNLSELNRSINEMSGIYWAWKNYERIGNPDFIGISHYRRYFIFDESLPLPAGRTWLPNSSCYLFSTLKDAEPYIQGKELDTFIKQGYNIVTTRQYDARLLEPERKNNVTSCEERFYEIADFDKSLYKKMEELVLQQDASYEPEILQLRSRPSHYTFNMFVMDRQSFFKYCEFVFPILTQLVKENKVVSNHTLMRAPGFLAEFLTSMFISHAMRVSNAKVKELNTCFIEQPNPPVDPVSINTNEAHNEEANFTKLDMTKLLFKMGFFLITVGKIGSRSEIEISKQRWNSNTNNGGANVKRLVNKIATQFNKVYNLLRI